MSFFSLTFFFLLFERMIEEGTSAECSLRTMVEEPNVDFDFGGSVVVNKVLLGSDALKDAFDELDWSSGYMTIIISPDEPFFRLSTTGPQGSCQVDLPKDAKVFEVFDCKERQMFSFKLDLLKPCFKALKHATKTQVRLNEKGILALRHMITTEDKQTSFVDFLLLPTEEEEE